MLKGQLPGIDEDLTLATALQAIWRGWLLGEAADQHGDAEGLARAMEWLIAGAAAGSKDRQNPVAEFVAAPIDTRRSMTDDQPVH